MELGLAGKRALVVGCGAIGTAIARALAAEAVRIVVADLRAEAAQALAAGLAAAGGQAVAHAVDLRDRASIGALFAATDRTFAGLDLLVNAAGVLRADSIAASSDEDWSELVRVNLEGVLRCAQAAIPRMAAAGGGAIVTLSSVSAFRGGGAVGNALYGTTKAAVSALTRGLAKELAPQRITANAIAPAIMDTPLTAKYLTVANVRHILPRIPAGRLATPADVAGLAVFLCSEPARFITGETIAVDGGYLLT